MIEQLDIFDFDGTLFRSPIDNEENRALFEKETGMPWIINKQEAEELSEKLGKHVGARNGWYGRAETLQAPLVPVPAPKELWIDKTVKAFFQSKSCKNTATVMMTGRHAGIQGQVLRILNEGNLVNCQIRNGKYFQDDKDVTCLFRGQSGPAVKASPMPNTDTISWKLWIIEKYVTMLPELKHICIWEDRSEHVLSFQDFGEILEQSVVVIHVRD